MTAATYHVPGLSLAPEDRAAFLAERMRGIGGSDAASVLGLNPYKSAERLWLEKTGQIEPEDADNYHKRRGRKFEPIIRGTYAERYPERGARFEPGQVQHPVHRFMLGHFDGVEYPDQVDPATSDGPVGIIEIKAPSVGGYRTLLREGLPNYWNIQGQHYLAISRAEYVRFVVYCADQDELLDFRIDRDDVFIAGLIRSERAFWQHVETRTPPPEPEQRPQAEIVVAGSVTKRFDAPFEDAARVLREATELEREAKILKDAAKARLQELAGAMGIYECGAGRFYWRMANGRKSFDKAALAGARPLDAMKVLSTLTDMHVPLTLAAQRRISEDCAMDLKQFEAVGDAFEEFRPYWFGRAE